MLLRKAATRCVTTTAEAVESYATRRRWRSRPFPHIAGGLSLSSLLLLTSCGSIVTPFVQATVTATPTFNLAAGTYTSTQSVTLSDTTPGAAIYYTTNGATPTAGSTPYTGAISVTSTETIDAIALASGCTNSAVASATYSISLPIAAIPTFSPPSGSYTSPQAVAISDTTPGAAIYYTTNGAAPTPGSTPYTGAISVTSTETIEAIAIAPGYSNSPVALGTYTITNAASGVGDWVWMSGSDTTDVAGVYGTLGAFSAGSFPGARDTAVAWTDSGGNLWLFGGESYTPMSGEFNFNDLWEFNPATRQWAWMSGSNSVDAAGVYGIQGTPSVNNIPGARSGGVSWIDKSGNLWLFGGYNPNIYGSVSYFYNDLWKFNPNTKEWTWVSGSNTPNASGTYGVLRSASATGVPGARFSAVSWVDSSGNFWLFGGEGFDSAGSVVLLNDLWEFNPASKEWTWVSGSNLFQTVGVYGTQGVASAGNVPGGRYTSSGWADSGGNFWLFGGQGYAQSAEHLYNDLWMFSTATQEWTWISGSNSSADTAGVYGTQGTAAAGNAPGARYFATSWTDGSGDFWLFGGAGYDASGTFDWLNDLWEFKPNTKEWAWMSGSSGANASGIYGTLGVASPSNVPGARFNPNSWTDSSGNLWLFGGGGFDASGTQGELNDLWRYQP